MSCATAATTTTSVGSAIGDRAGTRSSISVPTPTPVRTVGAEPAELFDRFAAVGGLADERDVGFRR
jgi:hypothetical protein